MKKIRMIQSVVLEEKKLRVCAYVRVSTDQAEQKNSFLAQMEHYTSYIKNNPTWNFAGIYADQALSGKNAAKRPDFQRMVKDAESKKFNLIITKSISRFARNTADCLETVRQLKSIGIGIYFEKENINTLNAESELMLSILSSVAEEELNSISQNMHWAYQRRFKQGKVMINTKRFLGYDKDRNGNLIINEEQATIVRRIFADYLSGLGISLIAKGLDGFTTISGNVKWAESTVRDILKNEKYVGDALLQKTITKDFKKKRNKGEAPMYYVKDTHPAIVSREDFEKAQELMVERAKSKGNIDGNREKYLKRYAFTSTIVCGHCGKSYKRHLDNCGNVAESVCWVCSAYTIGRKISCNVGRVKEDTIKGLFVRVFNWLYFNRAKLFREYKLKLEREKFTEFDHERIVKLEEEIESLIQQERALFFIERNGYTDHNLLKAEHEKLVGRLTQLQTERTTWMATLANQDSRIARTLELEAILDSHGGKLLEFSEDLYSAIIEKIVVIERTTLEFHLKNGLRFEEHYILKRGRDLF
ncbi:Site-specific recombinase, DNA invertase Pin [Candidatus Desulfosporosinus infrequens]|uniref:Site-specific recombinase, DNA invertase Pin n=1 Tax=Candidatus Desulfosporosinus infrequens TaxID=2043169 RepID=A0A2U3KY32_9FIRM|nr:Site-specific recombinase, DNA invertase Pin [Candidatus Desulfosporosinus infrequens]